jgi:hypothetical protein
MNPLFAKLTVLLLVLPAAMTAQEAPDHIHVIGASVSGGFEDGPLFGAKESGDSVSLSHMLKKWCDGEVKVTTHSLVEMCLLFRDPVKLGRKQIDRAKKKKADIIVAVDFCFWFAYGIVFSRDDTKARLADLEEGLSMLAEFDAQIVIGDLPDMTGAAPRMLQSFQIPSPESLKKLNARLQEFADENDNVSIVKLGKLVKDVRTGRSKLPFKDGALSIPKNALMQGDRLHLTRLGMSLLMMNLQDPLCSLFPKDHVMNEAKKTMQQLVEAAEAEDELATLREQVAK